MNRHMAIKKIFCALLAGLLFFQARLCAQQDAPLLPVDGDENCRQWVDSVMARLNLNERIGQLLVATLPARADDKTQKLVRDLARKYKVGGLLFAEGTSEEQAILTNIGQKNAKVPLMVTFDGEWGLSMRLSDAPDYPRNAALGCIRDNRLIEDYGREVARQFRELGVHVNFAPDADVNTNPQNPVIHIRSFGEDKDNVAAKVVAYGRGLEKGGVLAVPKHFPGHGDTDTDSHKALPVLRHDRARLDSVELYPFSEAIRAGLGGLMVGHLQVPAVEKDSLLPSSLSHAIVTGLLKEEMGFRGLVFTDALDMKGVTRVSDYYTKALLAGNDMLLVQYDTPGAHAELLRAVKDGTISSELVDERCRKVLTYKYILGLRKAHPQLQVSGLSHRINTTEARALAVRLRREAVTVIDNCYGVLPLSASMEHGIAVLSMGEEGLDSVFVEAMKRNAAVHSFRLPWNASEAEKKTVAEQLSFYSRVVVSIAGVKYVSEGDVAFLAGLELRAPIVYTFFTSYRTLPLLETALAKANAVVLAHSDEPDLQAHVADVLFAKASAHGRLSMSIGGLYPVGTGCDIELGTKPAVLLPDDCGMKSYLLRRIDGIAQKGVDAGAYPGCRILVLKDGKTMYDKGFGQHSPTDTTSVRSTDLFDLASVTKTAATLLAVMKLYDEGKLALDDKVSKYLDFLRGTNKRNITIRQLLLHESGLPSYIRFYDDAIDPRSIHGPHVQKQPDKWHRSQVGKNAFYASSFKFKSGLMAAQRDDVHTLHVADSMWLNATFKQGMMRKIAVSRLGGRRYVYSDLGFILLQQVVESIVGLPMDLYLDKEFYAPMGLRRTYFLPLDHFPKSEIMPTTFNDFLRGQDLCGYVHDESAAFMGGVSGNAGLFSTAGELAQIYQMLLDGGVWNGKRFLSEKTCRLFTTTKSLISRRGLGFDKPDVSIVTRSPCAPSAPEAVFGHTGFTGTCVWTDPVNRTVYVFLSNRICPNVWNDKLSKMDIRREIQELIFESLKKEH